MADPDDPGEDLIEKLGRAERQLEREKSGGFVLLIAFVAIILLGISLVAAFAAEPEVPIVEYSHKGSGVELHRPDGTTIFVNPSAIAFVRDPLPGEIGNALITFSSGAKQATRENVREIIEAVEKDRPQ